MDFALIANGSPAVFVEVKQPGLADGADQQLFEYAFHEGVPLAVLTDGATWSVYVPAEQGSYEDRRAYHLDVVERSVSESVERLRRYLDRSAVRDGSAFKNARRDCQSAKQRKGARDAMPQAWANLVALEDDALLDRLATEIESVSGFQSERRDVVRFLGTLSPSSGVLPKARKARKRAAGPAASASSRTPASDLPGRGFRLGDEFVPAKTGADILEGVFRHLAAADPTFLDRFAAEPHGKKRRYLSRSKDELFPGHPELHGNARAVGDGYWVSTHSSNKGKMRLIRHAASVAGVTLGDDLRVRFES